MCVTILKVLADAMAPDSKLLVCENVLQSPPDLFGAWGDMAMLSVGGKERNMAGFEDILGKAGLKINKVSGTPATPVRVLECVKV